MIEYGRGGKWSFSWQLPSFYLQGKNECRSFKRPTPSSPIKRYKEYWDWTGLSSVSYPKYEGVPYPLGRHETSPKGRTSIPQYSKASSILWRKPPDEWRADMRSKKGSLKKPSTTSSKPAFPHID